MNIFSRTVDIVKDILTDNINQGDIVIDATMGNGNDTLLLAKLVGESGKVYSFDVQEIALRRTEELLRTNGVLDNVQLINDGHENMDVYVKDRVQIVVFNLGYLPNSDERVITKEDTTTLALSKAIELINKGGIITIISYYGHNGGLEEKNRVDKFVKGLDEKKYKVIRIENYNAIKTPPVIYVVKRN